MTEVIFFIFGGLAIVSALYLLFTKNILNAALALVATLLFVAGIYVFAKAEFVAVTQIMIYVGGIVVLIIFGVMLTHDASRNKMGIGTGNKFIAAILTIAFFVMLAKSIKETKFPSRLETEQLSMQTIGQELMTTYLLPFELAAILLLVALIGAAVIAARYLKPSTQK